MRTFIDADESASLFSAFLFSFASATLIIQPNTSHWCAHNPCILSNVPASARSIPQPYDPYHSKLGPATKCMTTPARFTNHSQLRQTPATEVIKQLCCAVHVEQPSKPNHRRQRHASPTRHQRSISCRRAHAFFMIESSKLGFATAANASVPTEVLVLNFPLSDPVNCARRFSATPGLP
jgi:hypothetical protein